MRAMPHVSLANNHSSPLINNQTRDANISSGNQNDQKKRLPPEVEKMKAGSFWFRPWRLIDVATLCWITGVHILAACAPFVFDWGPLMVAMVLAFFTGMGMTLGYHRLLTHRSFKIRKWLEYFFVYCGVLAGQKDPMFWVSIHKSHHKYADTDRDPHSPAEGFWFSHIGWYCYTDYITAKSGESRKGEYSNVPELKVQWFYRFLHNTYFWHPTSLAMLLYIYGGFPYLAWGLGIRTVMVCHITFIVRSVNHIWGDRPWNTLDTSTNNWLTGVLAFGEGWHNNHHAFPSSARAGLEWWQFDLAWELIKVLELLGLVTDIKLPTEDDKRRIMNQRK